MEESDLLTRERISALKRIRRRGGTTVAALYEEPEMGRLFGSGVYDEAVQNIRNAELEVYGLPGVHEASDALRPGGGMGVPPIKNPRSKLRGIDCKL